MKNHPNDVIIFNSVITNGLNTFSHFISSVGFSLPGQPVDSHSFLRSVSLFVTEF